MESRMLDVKAFRLADACSKPANFILLGRRNTGKSVMISEILYHMARSGFPRALVFSATEGVNRHYEQFGIPKQFIFTQFSEDILRKLYNNQVKLFQMQERGEIPANRDLRVVVVIDDFGFNRAMYTTAFMNELFMNCRHVRISVILALQHAMVIPPAIRGQIDILIALREVTKAKREVIYKEYFSCFDDFGIFDSVMKQLTNNYKGMVFDNRQPDQDISKILFYVRAEVGRTCQFGSKGYRRYCTKPSGAGGDLAFASKRSRFNVTVRTT